MNISRLAVDAVSGLFCCRTRSPVGARPAPSRWSSGDAARLHQVVTTCWPTPACTTGPGDRDDAASQRRRAGDRQWAGYSGRAARIRVSERCARGGRIFGRQAGTEARPGLWSGGTITVAFTGLPVAVRLPLSGWQPARVDHRAGLIFAGSERCSQPHRRFRLGTGHLDFRTTCTGDRLKAMSTCGQCL